MNIKVPNGQKRSLEPLKDPGSVVVGKCSPGSRSPVVRIIHPQSENLWRRKKQRHDHFLETSVSGCRKSSYSSKAAWRCGRVD
ncbi:hypothetical protein O3P69_000357 [Scylla paramamosain]|uniref:Uncharacterized protein n=1 Tax=Scylla paramamosain TaxID=85552 RepID=A0AAW0V062_SCYPA